MLSDARIVRKVDNSDFENWWKLHMIHRLTAKLISKRTGIPQYKIARYLKIRRDAEGVARPDCSDSVGVHLKGRFNEASGNRPSVRF